MNEKKDLLNGVLLGKYFWKGDHQLKFKLKIEATLLQQDTPPYKMDSFYPLFVCMNWEHWP